jgi:hypothetical protein
MFRIFMSNKIKVAISGHAHRAGVYCLKKDTLDGKSYDAFDGDYACVRGWHFDDFLKHDHLKAFRDRTLVVVSDSAGPLPRENRGDMVVSKAYQGEWGSKPPSWTLVRFDPKDGKVVDLRSVYATNTNTTPRLAATLDYMEVYHAADAAGRMIPEWLSPGVEQEKHLGQFQLFSSEPLWQVYGPEHSNLKAWDDECIRGRIDPERDYFYTDIFSAMVSEPIDPKCRKRKESGIRFFFNWQALSLSGGCPIAGLDILWKNSDGDLESLHLDHPRPNASYLIASRSEDIETILGWSNRNPRIPKNVWFRWRFAAISDTYATDSPWILWGTAGKFENQKFSQIYFHRDLKANERPDLNIYKPVVQH